MEGDEMAVLKDTVCRQHLILQKLYAELEEEREASATATTEALSMILRLQGEKAAEKMEACQYKRVAEERMRYSEESLVMFEELLYQKEMEIASLRLQIQDYMEKSSANVCDGNDEVESSAEQLPNESDPLSCEKSFRRYLRRNSSLPILKIKELCSQIGSIDKVVSVRPTYSLPGCVDDLKHDLALPLEAEKLHRKLTIMSQRSVNWNNGLDQVKQIKEKVLDSSLTEKIIGENTIGSASSDNKCMRFMPMDYGVGEEGSLFPTKSLPVSFNPFHPNPEELADKQNDEKNDISNFEPSGNPCPEAISRTDTSISKNLKSFFRVPLRQKLVSNMSKTEDEIREESVQYSQDRKLPTLIKEIVSSSNLPATNDIKGFEKRLQKLEEDRVAMVHENFHVEEQMKLLKDIHEQLNEIQSYMCKKPVQKEIPQDTSSIASLMEAMLSISI